MDSSVYHGRGRPKIKSRITNDLALLIYNRRTELGYTIRDTANRSEGLLVDTNIQDIERGRSVNPRGLTIVGLSRALGLSQDKILETIFAVANIEKRHNPGYNSDVTAPLGGGGHDAVNSPSVSTADLDQYWKDLRDRRSGVS